MEKTHVIVNWDTNWADEMDVQGFVILTDKEWKSFNKKVKSIDEDFTISIGSNEEIEYSNGEELLEDLTIEKITQEEAKTITKVIGDMFGHVEFYDQVNDIVNEE
jgi:hypothetical protein